MNFAHPKDAPPPNRERCFEFLDLVWYFLRSTGSLCRDRLYEIDLEFGEEYGMGLRVDPDSAWRMSISGWFAPVMVSRNMVPGWMRIELEKIESFEESARRLKEEGQEIGDRKLSPLDLWVIGCLVGEQDHFEGIIEIYFSLL